MDFIAKYWIEAAFAAIVGLLSWMCKRLAGRMKYERQRHEALEKGLMALLRGQIVRSYHFNMRNGWIDVDELAAYLSMCEEYHNLGGNGAVEHLKECIKELPVRDGA